MDTHNVKGLAEADYSRLEELAVQHVRVTGFDYHRFAAALAAGIMYKDVNPGQRRMGKVLNYVEMYSERKTMRLLTKENLELVFTQPELDALIKEAGAMDLGTLVHCLNMQYGVKGG